MKQCPGIDVHRIIVCQLGQATKEIAPVFVVQEYPFSFTTPAHDMMQGTRGLPATCPLVPRSGRRVARLRRVSEFRNSEAGGHPILLTVAWFDALMLDRLM